MSSLDSTFSELRRRLRHQDALDPARSDPFFYFVHHPQDTLEVKRKLPQWRALLEQDGWRPEVLSLGGLMRQAIEASGRWESWLEVEEEADLHEVVDAVKDSLRRNDALIQGLRAQVTREAPGRVLLLTDAALLHPYYRTHTLETALHDQVKVPTVLFYPGRRDGHTALRFLGFYPPDGNYRSIILGGD